MEFNLELDRVVGEMQSINAKNVCVQLPDGLKPRAQEVVDFLSEKTNAKITIWAGSCFGACDTPNIDEKEYDLLVQWGHSEWKK